MPSEYHREVFGGEVGETCEFENIEHANQILGLLMRRWNTIAGALYRDEIHVPLIFEDEKGELRGSDWARGFVRGMHMRHDGWIELANDEERGGCLVPMMMLCHEHDEDSDMRPEPIAPEQREQVIAFMAAGLVEAYKYFREQRGAGTETLLEHQSLRRSTRKIGRNDPCPCGSGKKYKKCCGGAAVN